jgi:hypothetical protein
MTAVVRPDITQTQIVDSTGANTAAVDTSGRLSVADADVLAKLEAIRVLEAASRSVTGTVAVSNPTANPETGLAKDTSLGSLTETAPTTDTASSGLNGRLQRIAQRLTSLIGLLPTALGTGGGLKVDGSGTALPTADTTLAAKFANAIEIAPAATTMTAGAYTALDQVGRLLTFANVVSAAGRACRIDAVTFGNKANTGPTLELWLFNAAPTLTSPDDNNAWQPTAADMATLVDVIDTGVWRAGAATALNQWTRVNRSDIIVTGATTSLYGYLVLGSTGSLTGASTTDLTVRLGVTPDV